VDFVLDLEMTGGLGRRMGLAAREAVWEIGALLGRVSGIYRGAGGKLGICGRARAEYLGMSLVGSEVNKTYKLRLSLSCSYPIYCLVSS
jgi:hypothetical protein